MSDPLARRIVSTGTHEAPPMLGPFSSGVSMFSVPEPDGSGERLYVGFVEDLWDKRSRSYLWRGPVALRWKELRAVPERIRQFPVANPKRYRIDRQAALPGGRIQTSVMEINLEAQPALLLQLGGGLGQPRYLDAQPLGESLPMNDSLRLLVRLSGQKVFQTDTLRLDSYVVHLGGCPPEDWMNTRVWETAHAPHLLAISRSNDPGNAVLHYLPMRPDGWTMEKLLAKPYQGDANGSFVLQMLAPYLAPHGQGGLMLHGARYRVSISLHGMDITPLERGLEYDLTSESWEPNSGETKIKYVPKP
ncbi:MAG: hypothetical protein RDU24_15410 [Humidesulfovibrio sp.]|uniref:hypothetical protein n=1 Tax=Humidesulfovibrio sp. TaxID=2910988 RepID=UPI0027F152C6|nr:hypothetical protein [Humidesulfovibrio sp.]MDQ7836766.1 hypothetical protein [Humidesulfovibrio sp.]